MDKLNPVPCDRKVAIPDSEEKFTNYRKGTIELLTPWEFQMLCRFYDTIKLIGYMTNSSNEAMLDFLSNVKTDCHHVRRYDHYRNIVEPTAQMHDNFRDALTLLCSTVVRYNTWVSTNAILSSRDIRMNGVTLTPFECNVIARLNTGKNFNRLFKACHIHLYNIANKNVSDEQNSGTRVCNCLKSIFND